MALDESDWVAISDLLPRHTLPDLRHRYAEFTQLPRRRLLRDDALGLLVA